MLFDLFGADRLKCSEADVQSDFRLFRLPCSRQLREDLRSEMQSGGGSGD